jgi:hypothetical protein
MELSHASEALTNNRCKVEELVARADTLATSSGRTTTEVVYQLKELRASIASEQTLAQATLREKELLTQELATLEEEHVALQVKARALKETLAKSRDWAGHAAEPPSTSAANHGPRCPPGQESANQFLEDTPEDALLNQYWYSSRTVDAIVQGCVAACEDKPQHLLSVACLSTPSIFFSLPPALRAHSRVMEYDQQWAGPNFVFYDFERPEDLPVHIHGAFRCVPPPAARVFSVGLLN